MQNTIIDIVNSYGYLGIFLLILVENVFPPIPSEVILLFGGALTVGTEMSLPMVILVSSVGSVVGAIVLYFLGKVLKTNRLKQLFAGRFGKTLRLKPEYVDRASSWFNRFQNRAVFVCRFIPLIRSLISIPAGINEMNLPLFLLLTAVGSAIWNTVLVLLGAYLGSTWETALPYIKEYSVIIITICVIAAVAYVAYKLKKRRERNKPKE